jgi:hypothetical protein
MDKSFIDILQKLIAEQGKEALLNPVKCKAFLADYTKGEYKKESRLLLQALEAGVQKAIDTTEELNICKQQQIKVLQDEYFLAAEIASDVVDTLLLVLRGKTPKTLPQTPQIITQPQPIPKPTSPQRPYPTQVTASRKKTLRRNLIIALVIFLIFLICLFLFIKNKHTSDIDTAYNNESDFVVDWDTDVKGGVIIITYAGSKRDVRIPPSIQDYPVTSIGENAFKFKNITSITIPDSVTSIGNGTFSGCTSLTNVNIGNGVTSIGDSAFYNCSKLTSITIPDSVTSIGEQAFRECTSLTSVTIPSSVTSIEASTFYGCTSLASITIPNSVTSIGYRAFYGCTSLASITIPNSVTSIRNSAFSGCTSLTSVNIGNGVTSIGGFAFYNCSKLTSITIPDSVTTIEQEAFNCCTNLTSVTFQGTIISKNFSDNLSFPGDLREKYLVVGGAGGIGTYKRLNGTHQAWMKQ